MDYQGPVEDFCRNFFNKKRTVSVKKKWNNMYMVHTEEFRPYYIFVASGNLTLENFFYGVKSYRGIGHRIVYTILTSINEIDVEEDWCTIELIDRKRERKLTLKKDYYNGNVFFDAYFYQKDKLESHYSFFKENTASNGFKLWNLAISLKKLFDSEFDFDLNKEVLSEMRRLGAHVVIHDDDV